MAFCCPTNTRHGLHPPERTAPDLIRPLATLGEAEVKLKLLIGTLWCALKLS